MRSISMFGTVVVCTMIVGCADLLGLEPWEDKAIGSSASSSGGGASGETSSSEESASSGGQDPCSNGVQDGAETGVDCGGGACASCLVGNGCLVDGDCESDYCPESRGYCIGGDGRDDCDIIKMGENPTCGDCIQNGMESDVDCGGECLPCRSGKSCTNDGECWSNVCLNGKCATGATKTRCYSNDDCTSGACATSAAVFECMFSSCCQ